MRFPPYDRRPARLIELNHTSMVMLPLFPVTWAFHESRPVTSLIRCCSFSQGQLSRSGLLASWTELDHISKPHRQSGYHDRYVWSFHTVSSRLMSCPHEFPCPIRTLWSKTLVAASRLSERTYLMSREVATFIGGHPIPWPNEPVGNDCCRSLPWWPTQILQAGEAPTGPE